MTDYVKPDPSATAERALKMAIEDFGRSALSSSPVLSAALDDPLADFPRERELLVAAAGKDVVKLFESQVSAGTDPETAASLTASQLAERSGWDAESCQWAVAQFAAALGYKVSATPSKGRVPAADPNPGARAPEAGRAPQPSDDPSTVLRGAAPVVGLAGAPTGQPGPVVPGSPTAPSQHSQRKGWQKPPILVGGGVALVVVIVLVAVLASGGSGGKNPPSPSSSSTNQVSTPVATTANTVAAYSLSLTQLLSTGGGFNPAAECSNETSAQLPPGFTGTTFAFICHVPFDANWTMWAYMFNGEGSYQTSLTAFDVYTGFNPASASTQCPPIGSTSGLGDWNEPGFPRMANQNIECFTAAQTAYPVEIFTVPTQGAVVEVEAAGSSFTDLANWASSSAFPI